MPGKNSARRVIVPLVILLVIAGTVIWQYTQRRPKEVILSGSIESRSVMVGSLYGGRVAEVLIQEGATVVPGQRIATLQTDIIDRQIAEQQAAIDAQGAQLAKAEHGPRSEEIARARIQAAAYEKDRMRYGVLRHDGIVSQQVYDEKAAAANVAAQQLAELEHGTRPEDVQTAGAEVETAQRRLETLKRQREESDIRSSVAGVVQTIDIRPGDLVVPNQGVAEILEKDQMWVRVFVPEPLLGQVRLGTAAAIHVDSFPGRTFQGRVIQISSQAEYTPRNVQTPSQRADQVFGVKVAVPVAPELKPGMAARVDLGFKGQLK